MLFYDINYSLFLTAYSNKLAVTTSMEALTRRCQFLVDQNTHYTYSCFQNENCCPNGCCTSSFKKVMQFWYFWVLFFFVCIAIAGCMHYCKNVRKFRLGRGLHRENRLRRRVAQRLRSNRTFYTRPNDIDGECPAQRLQNENVFSYPNNNQRVIEPFDGESGEINEFILEQLLVSYRNNHGSTQLSSNPPNYNEIEKDPIYVDPPPRYCDACKQDSETQVNISAIQSGNADNDQSTTNNTNEGRK